MVKDVSLLNIYLNLSALINFYKILTVDITV